MIGKWDMITVLIVEINFSAWGQNGLRTMVKMQKMHNRKKEKKKLLHWQPPPTFTVELAATGIPDNA